MVSQLIGMETGEVNANKSSGMTQQSWQGCFKEIDINPSRQTLCAPRHMLP